MTGEYDKSGHVDITNMKKDHHVLLMIDDASSVCDDDTAKPPNKPKDNIRLSFSHTPKEYSTGADTP